MKESSEMVETGVKESWMLFSQPMVKELLSGHKTVTRRVMKKQPTSHHWNIFESYKQGVNLLDSQDGIYARFYDSFNEPKANNHEYNITVKFPYGEVGDYIWVKETFEDYQGAYNYKCGEYGLLGEKWKSSMFMPKKAARIWLKITHINIQRLNDISEEDCIKEGIQQFTKDGNLHKYGLDGSVWADMPRTAQEAFKMLWEKINEQFSWDKNPWVWVIEFEIDKERSKL